MYICTATDFEEFYIDQEIDCFSRRAWALKKKNFQNHIYFLKKLSLKHCGLLFNWYIGFHNSSKNCDPFKKGGKLVLIN